MNLFQKLKLSCTCSNSTLLPTIYPWTKARVKPTLVQIPPKHTHHMLNNSYP